MRNCKRFLTRTLAINMFLIFKNLDIFLTSRIEAKRSCQKPGHPISAAFQAEYKTHFHHLPFTIIIKHVFHYLCSSEHFLKQKPHVVVSDVSSSPPLQTPHLIRNLQNAAHSSTMHLGAALSLLHLTATARNRKCTTPTLQVERQDGGGRKVTLLKLSNALANRRR